MQHGSQHSIDSLFDDFDLSAIDPREIGERKPVTFWIPIEYKSRYDLIQKRSKSLFGKRIQKAVMLLIDRIDVEDEAG